jgi:hypothetical protein
LFVWHLTGTDHGKEDAAADVEEEKRIAGTNVPACYSFVFFLHIAEKISIMHS